MALETTADTPAPLRQISQLIDGYIGRLGAVWVEAEIAQLTRRQGVCFLTLRDLVAKISIDATCHASILDASPTPITEGSRVIVNAKPSFYLPRGQLALELREIRPQGEGQLLAQLERRKQLLAAEGLFDPRFKKTLPLLPRGIGLITGKNSAAERDVLQNARLRWPDVRFVVRHALMQGNGSALDVMRCLKELSARLLGRRHRHRPRRRLGRGPAAVLRRGADPGRACVPDAGRQRDRPRARQPDPRPRR